MSDAHSRAGGALGVTGSHAVGSLGEAVWAGAGWWPLVPLGVADGLVLAQGVVLLSADSVAATIGRSPGLVYFVLFVFWAAGAILAGPFGVRAALRDVPRAAVLAVGTALVGVGLFGAAAATGWQELSVAAGLGGIGSMLVGSARRPVLCDLYPPGARVRVHAVARAVALVVAAGVLALVELLPAAAPVTWRVGVGVAALVAFVAAALLAAMPDPGCGAPEDDRIRWLVHGSAAPATDGGRRAGLAESVRRVSATPTVKPLLALTAAAAALALALPLYGGFALTELGSAGAVTRALVLTGAAVIAAAVLLVVAPHLEAAVSAAPDRLLERLGPPLVATGVVLAAAGWLPLPAQAAVVTLAAAVGVVVAVVADAMVAAVLPPVLRAPAAVLAAGVAVAASMGATNLLSSADGEWGLRGAVLCLGLGLAATAVVARAASRRVAADHARVIAELVEREELVATRARGGRLPLLSCRRVSFSYGQLQVLFDVDFAVDEGEIVALLGTNGAGKSTLLKVISGVGMPSSGTVRLRGSDITYAEPGERVRAGVTQIPGGKAVFGPLTVAENLRLYGYALGRDRRAVDRGIEEAFATFPRLAERRNAPASTMSGGEQQMLALTKAFILKPQLLLIDELSLGLAPKVVGELLEMVRRINDDGTAVVLVEQSVNVALSLARHAYFMEKGAVRFDGPTAELLERPDVLRSVFLQGAAKGLGA